MWSIYMLRCSDNSFYTGITNNLTRRIRQHNAWQSGSKYVRSKRPAMLVYKETADTRSEALKREAAIKRLSHNQKEHLCMGLH
jgi:predicted GIY-YIG superfamily endonuclease